MAKKKSKSKDKSEKSKKSKKKKSQKSTDKKSKESKSKSTKKKDSNKKSSKKGSKKSKSKDKTSKDEKKSSKKKSSSKKANKKDSSKKDKSKKKDKKESKKKDSKPVKLAIPIKKISLENLPEKASKLWKNFKSNKILFNVLIWMVVFFVSLIVVDFGVQYLNYHASAAIVNGKRIYMGEFHDKLVKDYGDTAISQMIDEKLIHSKAEQEGVEITEEDIDEEMKQLEEDYGGKEALDNQLEMNNTSREQLRDQIETILIVQKILGDDIEITEEEKKEFFEQYKDVLFSDNADPTYEEAEEKIEEILIEQKVSQELQPWLKEIKSEASIKNNISSPKDYEFLRITKAFVNDLIENVLPEGEEDSDK
jgi:hypothetical protein